MIQIDEEIILESHNLLGVISDNTWQWYWNNEENQIALINLFRKL
jgi:hypothetical protein